MIFWLIIKAFFEAFANGLPGAVAQGMIWGIMAIGVYISYKILDIADLTVDGSICTGACVFAAVMAGGGPVWLGVLLAFLAGAAAGTVTGLLHTALGIPAILSGILTQLILYSVNLGILGGKSLMPIDHRVNNLLLHVSDNTGAIVTTVGIVAVLIIGLWLFFYTEVGLTLKSTGDNPDMSRAQGVNVNFNKVLGLAISNGIVALAGCLYGQYNGFADLNMGRGAIVIGLAAVIIGEVLANAILKRRLNFYGTLSFTVIGGVIYYLVVVVVLWLRLNSNDLKLFTAIVVALFLAIPYWRELRISSFAKFRRKGAGKNA